VHKYPHGYKHGQVVNIVDERLIAAAADEGGAGADSDGTTIQILDHGQQQFTLEMLLITVSAGAVAALVVGFVTGYCCGRKCRKDDLGRGGASGPAFPYPDTEYEYFEQRGGLARPPVGLVGAPPVGPAGAAGLGGGGTLIMTQGGGGHLGMGVTAPLLGGQAKMANPAAQEEVYAEPELVSAPPMMAGSNGRQHPPPPIRFPGPPSAGGSSSGDGGGGTPQSLQQAPHYSSSLLQPSVANKFNTLGHAGRGGGAGGRPLPSINHYESAAEARLGSGKDPSTYARGRDNFNSYHMSTLGRSGSGAGASARAAAAREPLLGDRGALARGGSGLDASAGGSSSNDSSVDGGPRERRGKGGSGQVVDSAYGTTTRSAKKVYL